MGTVLVVDDDEACRQTLRRVLARAGWSVHVAADRISAVFATRACTFDVAIVDQNLSGATEDRSGLDLAAELLERGLARRVVMHTGYGAVDAALLAGKFGAAEYLPKPATKEELLAAIDGARPQPVAAPATLEWVEREHCARVLAECDGRLGAAAARLGIHRNTLTRILARHGPGRPVRRRPTSPKSR